MADIPPAEACPAALEPIAAPPAEEALPPPADVSLLGEGDAASCAISDEALDRIRQRALDLLKGAGEKAYGQFPIDRYALARRTVGKMLSRANICGVLATPSGATEKDHNQLRDKFKGAELAPADAKRRGLKAARIPLVAKCPEGFDWANAHDYNDADECSDVTDTFGKGIATAMYSVRLPAGEALAFLQDPSSAPHYTRFANDGPIACGAGVGYRDSFHRAPVCGICSDLEFVLRGFEGKGWTAWTVWDSCTAEDGTVYSADDLMFSNGLRVFVPIDVEVDGQREARTIVLSQAAAASTSAWSFLISDDLPFHRFVGGELAKRLSLEAKRNGWEIK